jgi:two-component system, sporulation sensor kinase E
VCDTTSVTPSRNRQDFVLYGGIFLLTVGILVFDLLTPMGLAVPVLYSIPLLLTFLSPGERAPIYFCLLATSLLWLDLFLKPEGFPISHGVFNRMLGMLVMWGIVVGLTYYRRTQQGLISAEAARDQAVAGRKAAIEARVLSDAAASGALTRRHEVEGQLRASQLRLEGVIESAMDAIITVDEDQKVVLFNKAAETMFQCTGAEAIGQSLNRFLPQRFREAHRGHIRSFGESGSSSRRMGALGTVTGLRSSGEEFPLEASISHVSAEGKRYFTVILRDITERKKLEDARAHLASLVASSEDAIIGESLDGIVLSWNKAAEDISGYKADEVIGRPLSQYLPQEDREKERHLLARVSRGESIEHYEAVRLKKDGQPVHVSLTISPIRDESWRVVGASRIVRDMTEQKKLQEQLRRTERVAELGTLASGMAHEIGTPMNVILGRAEYLMERVKEEPIKKGLQTIVSQVERITRVMNQLLAFARRKPVERRPHDLQKTIEDNLEIFEQRLARHRIIVERSFAASCPPVFADADQMSQVVINLVMNAIHAMPEGGTLQVGVSPHEGMVRLIVADTGHGISQDVVAKIFDPFFTTKEFGKGTGLGLTVVKGIIEEHQGTIAVESAAGKGTTFTIHLPVYQPNS